MQSLIHGNFEGAGQKRVYAMVGAAAAIAAAIGPLIGGFITTYFHWRWIFWVNVPFGILGIVLASRLMPPIAPRPVPPLDISGFVLSGVGLAATIFGLTTLSRSLFSPAVAPALTVFGAALLMADLP